MDAELLTYLRQLNDLIAFIGNDEERFQTHKQTLDGLFKSVIFNFCKIASKVEVALFEKSVALSKIIFLTLYFYS